MAVLQQHLKTLSVSLADAILTISMNRPKVNAMSAELLNDLEQAFDHASKNNHIKGVHLRSNFNSTFSAGLDLSYMHEKCSTRDRSTIDKFIFTTLSRGVAAPLHCSKPVACSLDGHAIAGGIILALACDYIAMGTRKPFRIGITELAVGVPFPSKPLAIVRNQLEPQLAHRLIFDANHISSNDFPIRCERSETPDDLARKWLKMISERPLKGFQITKQKWWSDVIELDSKDNEKEKKEYFDTIFGEDCLQAMKQTLQNSTFSAGADLSTVYNLSIARQRAVIDNFVFETLSRGMTAPLHCSKPVACSLDGHTIAGGLILALSCDYIAMGTRKPFRIGITGPIVGIPYPLKAVKLVQHQLEPQLGYRFLVDANLVSSNDFPIRCERSETPDDLARKWLKMISERPLKGFQITKQKWWSDVIELDSKDNEKEKQEYFEAVTSDECMQAMKKALNKDTK
ncbi:unnamed protein product [Rotaria socialis]